MSTSASEFANSIWPDGPTLPLRPILVIATALVVALLVRQLLIVGRRLWRRSHPLRLYFRVAGEAGLSLGQMWWLWRVARARGLSTPLTLLVCDATLMHHVELTAESMSPRAARRMMRHLAVARDRLFLRAAKR